jgi:CheY-like chemotaxis protein
VQPLQSVSILIVDDDREVCRALEAMLAGFGAETAVCHDGASALARLKAQTFDLLLIDYRMPELTGLDLVRALREDSCTTPIMIVSGYYATAERLDLEKPGIQNLLRKPFSPESLLCAVESCLPRRSGT